jgi:hypothetical protein
MTREGTSKVQVPLALKLQISFKSLGYLLSKPSNILVSSLLALLMLGVLLWSFNVDLLIFIFLKSPLSLGEKILFLFNGYASLFTNLDAWPAVMMVLLSVLFGINGAIFIYLVRRTAKLADSGKGIAASVLGLVGAGCGVCGTGILGPVLAGLGAGASASLSMWLGLSAQILGIILLKYSIFGLSVRAASLRE